LHLTPLLPDLTGVDQFIEQSISSTKIYLEGLQTELLTEAVEGVTT